MGSAGPDDELRPGDVLAGKYEITGVLGRGGMGLVAAARDMRSGARVAIKVPRREVRVRKKALARFERESRAASKLGGPHVVRVTDVDRLDDGTPFMVMELLLGRDLASELERRGTLPLPEALSYVLQAALGVAEAHAAGIVHRDLKPHNLFLVEEPRGRVVKVLDFGISKLGGADIARMTTTNTRLGTPLYVSPEQLRSAKYVDHRSDLWSLGVILYQLVTGMPPFSGTTALAVAASIQTDEPLPPSARVPALPVELDAVIQRALSKDVTRRFRSAEEFATALLELGAVSPSGVARLPVPSTPAPGAAPHPLEPKGQTHADTPRRGESSPRLAESSGVRRANDARSFVLLLLAAVLGVGLLALALASR